MLTLEILLMHSRNVALLCLARNMLTPSIIFCNLAFPEIFEGRRRLRQNILVVIVSNVVLAVIVIDLLVGFDLNMLLRLLFLLVVVFVGIGQVIHRFFLKQQSNDSNNYHLLTFLHKNSHPPLFVVLPRKKAILFSQIYRQLLMSFKSVSSFKDLTRHAQNTSKITKQITKEIILRTSNFSIFFSLFLANSKGKDKFIALFQYLFQFFCACGKHSNIPENALAYKNQKLVDMVVYYHLKENISSARKVFRLFRFFDQIKGLTKILKTDKPKGFKLLSVFTYCCSITYYISDNVLWALNILVKSNVMDKALSRSWKQKKNFSSFYRVVAYTCILIYSIYLQNTENSKNQQFLVRQGQAAQANIEAQEKAYNKLLQGRRKVRFLILELFLSFFRFLMLTKSLKLKWHQNLDPVFIGVCGLCSATLGFLKALLQKKIVINIQSKDGKETESKVSMSRLRKMQSIESSKFW